MIVTILCINFLTFKVTKFKCNTVFLPKSDFLLEKKSLEEIFNPARKTIIL